MPPPSSQAKPDEPPNQFLSVQCAPKPGCTRTSRVAVSGSIGRRRRSGCRTRATCTAVALVGAGHAPAQSPRRTPRSGRSRTRTAIRRGAARCVDEATRRTHRSARRLASCSCRTACPSRAVGLARQPFVGPSSDVGSREAARRPRSRASCRSDLVNARSPAVAPAWPGMPRRPPSWSDAASHPLVLAELDARPSCNRVSPRSPADPPNGGVSRPRQRLMSRDVVTRIDDSAPGVREMSCHLA